MKKFKKLSMIALSLAAALTIVTTAMAAGTSVSDEDVPTDLSSMTLAEEDISTDLSGMILVEETETFEDGLRIVDRTYIKGEVSAYSETLSKPGYLVKERSIYDTEGTYGTLLLTMRVSGMFTFDGESAYVTNSGRLTRETKAGEGSFVREIKFVSASDQGSNAFWGNKYAYVEYIIRAKINDEEKDFRLWLDVDRNGDVHVNG